MKKELDYIRVDEALGGNQDWFLDPFMKGGGCAAVTACDLCIYFARHRGLRELYPYDAGRLGKEDYIRFSKQMKPYLRPRWQGIDTLDIYLEGIQAYWKDVDCKALSAKGLSGTEPFEMAKEAVCGQIDKGIPVPFLLLRHKEPRFKDYVWHWFNLAGYEEFEEEFFVKAVTYGEMEWLNLRKLWDTGFERRGGMILLQIKNG
ncbi:hypothetical protein [Candidatus Merdisoma sp. JLR.KK006]|uniref:hypothetical protein n=1 Tax=Candidatus Merdisoma sp. JLR.KK006 TaxID=3112626 RepID=UPI002FF09128